MERSLAQQHGIIRGNTSVSLPLRTSFNMAQEQPMMQNAQDGVVVHETAAVDSRARLAPGVRIWHWTQVREGAVIGAESSVGKSCYIDADVRIGSRVKIQNNVSIFHGVTIEDGVFVGPHVCFTNDKSPRAINPDGTRKGADNWTVTETLIRYGASIGANATVICGASVGRFAMVAAGAVVTRSVPDYGLVMGNPARLAGYVCPCGLRLPGGPASAVEERRCPECDRATLVGG